MPNWRILQGHCVQVLRQLPAESIQCVVTSPPYYQLRDYGGEPVVWGGDGPCSHVWTDAPNDQTCLSCGAWRGCLGLEPTPEQFVDHLVEVFREVRRVLRADGTCWVNIGDSYAPEDTRTVKEKDLTGVPWLFALAMRRDGWYLRSDIIWEKPNTMPEPVTDRPTRSHEFVFLFTKMKRGYFYDADAIREEWADERKGAAGGRDQVVKGRKREIKGTGLTRRPTEAPKTEGRNARTVWRIPNAAFPGAHFATFPPELPRRCVRAGAGARSCARCGTPWARKEKAEDIVSQIGDILLQGWAPACDCGVVEVVPCVVADPFSGSGTTGEVALEHGCDYIGIEQVPEHVKLSQARLSGASRADLKAGDTVFCPGCEREGRVKMFSRGAVEKARLDNKKITCPACLGRFTAADLGVKT